MYPFVSHSGKRAQRIGFYFEIGYFVTTWWGDVSHTGLPGGFVVYVPRRCERRQESVISGEVR